MTYRLFLLNALITPYEGREALFKVERITPEKAKEIYQDAEKWCEIISAVGHEATAKAFKLIGIPCNPNRIQITFYPGDRAIALTLKRRPPEGKTLTLEEMQLIGYDLHLIHRIW